jgi:fibronectin-binding autotransporter adhesin
MTSTEQPRAPGVGGSLGGSVAQSDFNGSTTSSTSPQVGSGPVLIGATVSAASNSNVSRAGADGTSVTGDPTAPDIAVFAIGSTVKESAKSATVKFQLSKKSKLAFTADVLVKSGSAKLDADYRIWGVPSKIGVAPGKSSVSFSIPLVNDKSVESDETFTVVLTNVRGARRVGIATITIRDDDRGR